MYFIDHEREIAIKLLIRFKIEVEEGSLTLQTRPWEAVEKRVMGTMKMRFMI